MKRLIVLMLLLCLYPTAKAEIHVDTNMSDARNTDPQCLKLARSVMNRNLSADSQHISRLIECLAGEYFYFDKGAARLALTHIGEPALTPLISALKHSDYRIAEGAAHTLGLMGRHARPAIPALKALARSRTTSTGMRQRAAAMALGKIGEIDFLMRTLQNPDLGIPQYLAMQGLGAAGENAAPAIPALMTILNDSDGASQMQAARALGDIGAAANAAVPRLEELTGSSLNFVRNAAGEALIKIGTPQALAAAKPYQQRKYLVESFYQSMSVFISAPWLAALFGVVFAVIAFSNTRTRTSKRTLTVPLYISATLWLLYAVWEFYAGISGANIRIDLLLIYPILFIVTLLSLVIWLSAIIRSKLTP